MPKVSVIMPIYNGEKYLIEAINSILRQTFSDFEFLIINDGSTDKSDHLLGTFSDSRIKLMHHHQNLGLVETLNQAFQIASGEYLIRMDCDDISKPNRIEKQIQFLDHNSSIGVVGTFCKTFGFKTKAMHFPIQHENIKISALFDSPMAHPTVAIRKSILPTPAFDSHFAHAEDYELWTRLLHQDVHFHTIPEFFLRYRVHENQVSTNSRATQLETADTIRAQWLHKLGLTLEKHEMLLHRRIAHGSYTKQFFDPIHVCDHLERLLLANQKYAIFNQQIFLQELAIRNLYAFSKTPVLSKRQFLRLIHSPLWLPQFFIKKIPKLLFKKSLNLFYIFEKYL